MSPDSFLMNLFQKRPALSVYLGGLLANLIYVAVLISIPGGSDIFNAPFGFNNGQYWMKTDAINYVRPAKYFLTDGAFLDYLGGSLTPSHWGLCSPIERSTAAASQRERLTPTYHREIGYPLLIAVFMKVFGPVWDIALAAAKVFIFALIYPFLFLTAKLIFPSHWRPSFVIWPFLFLIASGTFIVQVPFYLADMTLTLCFLMGIYYGLKSQLYLRWSDLLGHLFFIGLAAIVKSTLVYFVLVDVLILASFAYYRNTYKQPRSRQFILISFMVVLPASQFNSFRNFINHDYYKPTDVLATNLFCFLAKEIADLSGNKALYTDGVMELYKIDSSNIKLIDQKKTEKAKEIIVAHPGATGYILMKHGMSLLFHSHYHFFGRTLIKDPPALFVWIILFPLSYLLYTFLYVSFSCFCLRLIRQKQYFLLVPIVSVVGYMLVPTLLVNSGSRMRLPIEGIILIFAFAEVYCWTQGSYLLPRTKTAHDPGALLT